MLERAETGNKIELSVGKGQFFRWPAMKLRMGQRIPSNIQGHSREIDSRRDSAEGGGRAQPEAGPARNVQNSFPVPRLEAGCQPSEMPGHRRWHRAATVIHAIVEVANRIVVEAIHLLISARPNRHSNVKISTYRRWSLIEPEPSIYRFLNPRLRRGVLPFHS